MLRITNTLKKMWNQDLIWVNWLHWLPFQRRDTEKVCRLAGCSKLIVAPSCHVHSPKMSRCESFALQCEERTNWAPYEGKLFQCRSICCSAVLKMAFFCAQCFSALLTSKSIHTSREDYCKYKWATAERLFIISCHSLITELIHFRCWTKVLNFVPKNYSSDYWHGE